MRIVGKLGADFRRHVGATTSETRRQVSFLVRRRKSPVNNLQVVFVIEAYIFRLQVPVRKPVILHVLDCGEELPCEMANCFIVKWRTFDVFKQLAHRCVLLHCVDYMTDFAVALAVLTIVADAVKLNDVNVGCTSLERSQLAHQVAHLSRPLALILKLEDFYSKASILFHSQVHFTCVTFANLFDKPILVYLLYCMLRRGNLSLSSRLFALFFSYHIPVGILGGNGNI